MTIDQLNQKFAIPGIATFEPGHGGLPRLTVTGSAADAHVYLLGAHVTHFQPHGQPPLLYMSAKSAFEEGKPIRGGVPVIFPWFGPRDGLPQAMHGFVRQRAWDVQEVTHSGGVVHATFSLESSNETRQMWDHEFALRFTVVVGSQLTMELEVRNT